MYVKLKDKGSIFFDPTQNAKVTGDLPKEVKNSPRVAAALRNNILVEVSEEKALKILEARADEIEAAEKGRKKLNGPAVNNSEVKKLKDELKEQKEATKTAEAVAKGLGEELETSKATLAEKEAEIETLKAAPAKEDPKAGAESDKGGKTSTIGK